MPKRKPRIKLLEVLKQKKITKYKFSQLLNKPTSHIYQYFKKDYNPTLATLTLWAEALDCKIRDLIEE